MNKIINTTLISSLLLMAGTPIHDKMDLRIKGKSYSGSLDDNTAAEDGLGILPLQHHSGTTDMNNELLVHKVFNRIERSETDLTKTVDIRSSLTLGSVGTINDQSLLNNYGLVLGYPSGTLNSCKEIKTTYPTSTDGNYNLKNIGDVYCDMTTDGGGWTMYYTSSSTYHLGDKIHNTISYGTPGYSRDISTVPFKEILYVRHSDNAKDWFSRNSGVSTTVSSMISSPGYINQGGSNFGLWTGHGGANTSYSYQLTVGDGTWMEIGLMITGYTSCYKVPNSWCGDTSTSYYRVDGDYSGSTYKGVAFRENGHRTVTYKTMSVGIR